MEGFSLVGALVKVVLVIGLLVVVMRFLGRLQGGTGRTGRTGRPVGRPVDVVGRSALGRRASLVVVRVGKNHFALGVTDERVTVIGPVDIDLPEAEATPALPAPPAGTQAGMPQPSWKEFVERLRERTVRH